MEDFLFGLLGLFAAVETVVELVKGVITELFLKDKMRENGLESAVLEAVDRCNHVVKLKDLDSPRVLKFQGEDIASDIYEGNKLYV